jgi:DNA-binding IclR family transcriptional regulator
MKIILSEAQVKKLLDTLTNETILEESKKTKTFELTKSI